MSALAAETGTFAAPDGFSLHTSVWKPAGTPKARLIHLHGFSDHAGRGADFFPTLAKAGIEVCVLDKRGWGRSVTNPKDQGNTGGTEQVMADINHYVKSNLTKSFPVYVSGHSMGGGEVLWYASHGPKDVLEQLAGVIAYAPWITLDPATQPGGVTVFMGRIFGKLMPQFKLVQNLDPSLLSHDDAMNQTWLNDPLCHNKASLQTFDGCLRRAEELFTGKALPSSVIKRILVVHGEEDHVTSPDGSKNYAKHAKDANLTLKLYPNARHCLHVEPDTKEEFFTDVISFILTPSGSNELQSKL